MMRRPVLILGAAVVVAAGYFWVLAHPFMSFQRWSEVLIWAAAIPATTFVVAYPVLSPQFFRSWIGRGLWTSSFGLAALLDLSLLAQHFQIVVAEWALLTILFIIALGAWLKLAALLREKWVAVHGSL